LYTLFISLGLAWAMPVQAQVCVPTPSGLVGWWPGELNAIDIAGGNNGTIQGALGFAPGKVGQSFSSNGTGGMVAVGVPHFPTPNTGFTVEAWVNPATLGYCFQNRCRSIAHRELNLSSRTWWLGLEGPWIRFLLFLSPPISGRVDLWSPALVVPGAFQHVAASYDGNTIRLYYNGALVTTQLVGPANFSTNDPVNIGSENLTVDGNYDPFDGTIDELSIYNRALTDVEIADIVNAGTAGKCLPGPVPEPDGEVDGQNNNGQHEDGNHDR
jgi:hypothetical protein